MLELEPNVHQYNSVAHNVIHATTKLVIANVQIVAQVL